VDVHFFSFVAPQRKRKRTKEKEKVKNWRHFATSIAKRRAVHNAFCNAAKGLWFKDLFGINGCSSLQEWGTLVP
jgi:hypothetical protein